MQSEEHIGLPDRGLNEWIRLIKVKYMNINRSWVSRLKLFLIVLMVSYLPLQGYAWGVIGHRVVGEIASYHLTTKAKKEIARILRTQSIAMASN